jgi:hypothetical protein
MSDELDLDERTYAIINANTEAAIRVQSFQPPDPPKEKAMSMATVLEQRRKIADILAKFAERRQHWTEGPRGE